jgi:uroporphyrinogen-III synthase
MAFGGLRVLSLESRRAKEMEALIRREGGDPFVAPSVEERALDDQHEALDFVDRVGAGEFDLVVCMTGAGLAFLRDVAAANGRAETLARGLQSVFIVSRGPKPLPILREMGAKAHVVVPEPNTWKEVVEAVAARGARRIAVQEYGRPNEEMNVALRALGAQVECFAIYRWDLPADLQPLVEAVRRMATRDVDVALFTSSIQLDHLFRIAEQRGFLAEVRSALQEHTAIASVGPIMTDAITAAGLLTDIVPTHPKMAALVKAAAEGAGAALARKRSAELTSQRGPTTHPSA